MSQRNKMVVSGAQALVVVLLTISILGCESTLPTNSSSQQINYSTPKYRNANFEWRLDGAADPGSIVRLASDFEFRPSVNKSETSVFAQRSEISSSTFSATNPVTYRFEADVSMTTQISKDVVIFQLYASTPGCAPPMSLRWRSDNTLSFDGDFARRSGSDGCVENVDLKSAMYTGPRLSRTGNEFRLAVEASFDGNGDFVTEVYIDETLVMTGSYVTPEGDTFDRRTSFYMKHGANSPEFWPFVMLSKNPTVLRRTR